MRAIFTDCGPLGIKFGAVVTAGDVERMRIVSVRAGTPAASFPQLRPGLLLVSLSSPSGGVSVVDLGYKGALKAVKRASRPLELRFETDPGAEAAAEARDAAFKAELDAGSPMGKLLAAKAGAHSLTSISSRRAAC